MYYVSRIAGGLAVPGLLAAAWYSILLARADYDFRAREPEAVGRAIELAPLNTEYLAFRALQLEYAGADATPALERAARLAPLASAPRIRLGLAAEMRGDFDAAERWLLGAAGVDRQFEPRWALANYYFRREKMEQFWKWMRLALEMSYGDRRPAFDLCWRASSGPPGILARTIPDRHDVLAAYLAYLLESHRAEAAFPVALKLADAGDAGDRPVLWTACEEWLDAGNGGAALELWRRMGYPVPSGIFHGNFEAPRIGRGFDWRLLEVPGVTHAAGDALHRISLNGRQPESCQLLRQMVLLRPGMRYRFRWESRTASLGSPSGVEWRMGGEGFAISSSDGWRKDETVFVAPASVIPLTLAYRRPSGQPRAEGSLELSHVAIEEVTASSPAASSLPSSHPPRLRR